MKPDSEAVGPGSWRTVTRLRAGERFLWCDRPVTFIRFDSTAKGRLRLGIRTADDRRMSLGYDRDEQVWVIAPAASGTRRAGE